MMKKNKKVKDFDAVKMMRTIRNDVNKKIRNMNFEELRIYIESELKKNPSPIFKEPTN